MAECEDINMEIRRKFGRVKSHITKYNFKNCFSVLIYNKAENGKEADQNKTDYHFKRW